MITWGSVWVSETGWGWFSSLLDSTEVFSPTRHHTDQLIPISLMRWHAAVFGCIENLHEPQLWDPKWKRAMLHLRVSCLFWPLFSCWRQVNTFSRQAFVPRCWRSIVCDFIFLYQGGELRVVKRSPHPNNNNKKKLFLFPQVKSIQFRFYLSRFWDFCEISVRVFLFSQHWKMTFYDWLILIKLLIRKKIVPIKN